MSRTKPPLFPISGTPDNCSYGKYCGLQCNHISQESFLNLEILTIHSLDFMQNDCLFYYNSTLWATKLKFKDTPHLSEVYHHLISTLGPTVSMARYGELYTSGGQRHDSIFLSPETSKTMHCTSDHLI